MKSLEGMRLLMTGGTGFFGRSFLRHLAEASRKSNSSSEHSVVVLSRNPNLFVETHPYFKHLSWLDFAEGDILDPDSLPISDKFTHILHAAADSRLGPTSLPLDQFSQIVDGTRNILNFAAKNNVKRVLLTSSGAVYGPQPNEQYALPEDWRGSPGLTSPSDTYGLAKRAAEHLCALYGHAFGIETTVARCFAFVGPDLPTDVHFAIGNFIRDALTKPQITVNGDGTPLRTFLDQDDLARWLLTLLQQGSAGQAYNVGSNEVISIADLAYLVRDILAPEKPVRILGQRFPVANRSRYIPDISKPQRELGLCVTIPLAEAIRRTGDALRSNLSMEMHDEMHHYF